MKLIDLNTDLNYVDMRGEHPLIRACMGRLFPLAQYMIENREIDLKYCAKTHGITPFMVVCWAGHLSCAKRMLQE